jgi:hypothetical protein
MKLCKERIHTNGKPQVYAIVCEHIYTYARTASNQLMAMKQHIPLRFPQAQQGTTLLQIDTRTKKRK